MRQPIFNSTGNRGTLSVLIVLLSLLSAAPAAAEKRVALVVGNSAYQNITRLDNPRNDAVLMADTLGSLGFTLMVDAPSSISTKQRSTPPCKTSDGRSRAPKSRCSTMPATAFR